MEIAVLITSSLQRIDELFTRSLPSVLAQTMQPSLILVVDDNAPGTFRVIDDRIAALHNPAIIHIPNTRTRGMSGTGAWNTGLYYLKEHLGEDAFVAILDDDDSWDSTYLENISAVAGEDTDAVFAYLKRSDCDTVSEFSVEDLSVNNFLTGNPGVQGSNMVFRLSSILEIGGFDECLASCTDRDLMIRFLERFGNTGIRIIRQKLVNHFAGKGTVTYDYRKKAQGLDKFYEKHLFRYDASTLQSSLERSRELFKYPYSAEIMKKFALLHSGEAIAIGVAMHNNSAVIGRCLQSIFSQKNVLRKVHIVVADDASTDNWKEEVLEFKGNGKFEISFISLSNCNVSKTRNAINDYIVGNIPEAVLIGRLDADDYYAGDDVLSRIEKRYDEKGYDVILAGNRQARNGEIIDFVNYSTRLLLDYSYLRERVRKMAEGDASCELPSCNIFVRPSALTSYPDISSGEDHFFLTGYLLDKANYSICCAEDIVLTVYNLGGEITTAQKKTDSYYECRRQLYEKVACSRRAKALEILEKCGISGCRFLGEGKEGIVFHNDEYVYKIYDKDRNRYGLLRQISYFLEVGEDLSFYRIDEVVERDDALIIKYRYEESEPCTCFSKEDCISILVDLWRNRLIIKDCRPGNTRLVNGRAKIVDLQGYEYDDNLFYNLCARLYIYYKYGGEYGYSEIRKLTRSAINNFDLPELAGLREFVNEVFANIIYEESKEAFPGRLLLPGDKEVYSSQTLPNLEDLFFSKLRENKYLVGTQVENISLNSRGYFEPADYMVGYRPLEALADKVTLLIKTCPQDVQTIEENIKHIVRQLSAPNPFAEIVVSVDTKESGFLREFYSKGSLDELLGILGRLRERHIIDRIAVFPEDETKAVNMRWFGLDCSESHSAGNAPVASQLYAFEQCSNDYILQCDSDVLIGRRDISHSYLSDMLGELKKNSSVISVGFNICNSESKPYFGFEDGGFVPEVRFCLIDRKRLYELRPLPNSLVGGRLNLSWFRSLELYQKEHGVCSVRGGNADTFYIHPQNYRKTDAKVWTDILDRVEQLQIPDVQLNHFDCEGSYLEWCAPKRDEQIIVACCFADVPYDRFLRMWYSLMSQTYRDFGILLYDDSSKNGLQILVDSLIEPVKDRVTFVKSRVKRPRMENMYRMIHHFCSNPDSIIVCVDGDDAIIGRDTLLRIYEKYMYSQADVVVGRMHQTYRLQPHYRYPVDFSHPRIRGGNVWQHIKTFRKYLFDSIPLRYFKHTENQDSLSHSRWISTCDDYAIMVPIVEMSRNPVQLDFICYYYERDFEHRNDGRDLKEKCIGEILSKPALSPEDICRGRKEFLPAMKRIEIDITYDCNLKCEGCNRSCAQAPCKDSMTLEQIASFIEDSIASGIQWDTINVLGGEPTLHPQFYEIVRMLQNEYVCRFSPDTVIQVVSNGIAARSRELCRQVREDFPNVRIDYNSFKTGNKVEYFSAFNDAPVDDARFKDADYSRACWVAAYCGVGLNGRGYYGCALCGGIDRVLGGDRAYKSLAELSVENLKRHYTEFCRYCGNFKAYASSGGECIPRCEKEPFRNIISPTWIDLYKNGLNLP